jgi:TusE/DsrC/DsvC family sulfur relay protein
MLMCPGAIVISGRRIELVNCLPKNKDLWSPEIAKVIAEINGIRFTDDMQRVIELVRDFWQKYHVCPPMSILELLTKMSGSSILKMFKNNYDIMCVLAGIEPPSGCLSRVLSTA